MSARATAGPKLTIQDIVQVHGLDYFMSQRRLPIEKLHALLDIAACQTGAFGTHLLRCEDCGYMEQRPNSCRNRHCPSCGGRRKAVWSEKVERQLLPTAYMQVVFTLPHELIPLLQRYARELYDLLFRSAWGTLKTLAADPQHLGAKLGGMAVLHTWNQKLLEHPHLHFVLPAGGVSLDGQSWVHCQRLKGKEGQPGGYFLFPFEVISKLFRGKFLAGLTALVNAGKIDLSQLPQNWNTAAKFKARRNELYAQKWVVYQEPPPPDCEPAALVKYLARYVAGMAISDARLVSSDDTQVTFKIKNRKDGGWNLVTLPVDEFLRRYLLHVLPARMARVRYYGFWHSRCAAQLEQAKVLCAASTDVPPELRTPASAAKVAPAPAAVPTVLDRGRSCPHCQTGIMELVGMDRIWGWSGRGALLLPGRRLRRWSGPRVVCPGRVTTPASPDPPAATGPPVAPDATLPTESPTLRVRMRALFPDWEPYS